MESEASEKAVTFDCAADLGTLEPSLDSGEVFSGANCDNTVSLQSVAPGATLSQLAGTDPQLRSFKLVVPALPVEQQELCVKCAPQMAGKSASGACLVRIIIPAAPQKNEVNPGKDQEEQGTPGQPASAARVSASVCVLASLLTLLL